MFVLQEAVDKAIADAVQDALATDAAADAAQVLALNAQINILVARVKELEAAAQPTPTPPPTPTPTPIPTAGWPTASNTGVPAGVTLKASGPITTTAANQVIEGLNITGGLQINHSGVVVKNCKITSGGYRVVMIKDGVTPPKITDCEIVGTGAEGANGIDGQVIALRLNIWNVENGWNARNNGSRWTDCYIHDLKSAGAPHYDGVQLDGGISDVIVEHCTIICPPDQTAAVMTDNYFGGLANITFNNNRLVGGGYTIYCDGQFSGGAINSPTIRFTNNRVKAGQWGYRNFNKTNPVWTGNVDDVTGKPI